VIPTAMNRQDLDPLQPEYPDITESPLRGEGITPFERWANLVVAAVLVVLGLYALFAPI